MTVEFAMSNNLTMINRLIIVLGKKLCLSHNSNTRKGGLLGLAAVMVGFQNGSIDQPSVDIVEEVVRPILTCLLDSDPRVRYYACESLYNVTKVAKATILPLFADIFDDLAKIIADPDIGVRSGAELLDRLIKDIIVEHRSFDTKYLPDLKEYLYTKNPFTRMFLISWIRFFSTKIDMIKYLDHLLDGIFSFLGADTNEEILAATLSLLDEFLNKIVVCPTDAVKIPSLIKILYKHAKNEKEEVVQYRAIAWIRQLIKLIDDRELMDLTPGILDAILPCLAFQPTPEGSVISSRDNKNVAREAANLTLHRFIPHSPSRGNICEIANSVNSMLLEKITEEVLRDRRNSADAEVYDLEPIIDVIIKELHDQEHPVIRMASLEWLKKLKRAEPDIVLTPQMQPKLFQILLSTLSARSDAVVKSALRVIADLFCFDGADEHVEASQVATPKIEGDEAVHSPVEDKSSGDQERKRQPTNARGQTAVPKKSASSLSITKKTVSLSTSVEPLAALVSPSPPTNANLTRFIQALCKMFKEKDTVFEERGSFIIVNLCTMVKPDVIFKSFADMMREEKLEQKFAQNLVQKLNTILLTTQPLASLRCRLSSSEDDPEMIALFQSLHSAWCYSPIAALTLCLLTANYKQASEIVMNLSQSDITVDLLTQLDWVVQLIESPVFASLRMRLLDLHSNQSLLQSLYGILMILPQSEAYKKLGCRLDYVYKFANSQPKPLTSPRAGPTQSPSKSSNLGAANM